MPSAKITPLMETFTVQAMEPRRKGNSKQVFLSSSRFHCLLSLLFIVGVGCGRKPEPSQPDPVQATSGADSASVQPAEAAVSTDERQTAGDSQGAQVPLDWLTLPGDGLVAETAANDWQSESVGEEVGDQLKALGELFCRSRGLDSQDLRPLLSDTFECTRLRPQQMDVAFQADGLTVSRGIADSQFIDQQGANALSQVLRDLLPSNVVAGDARLRFEQKVVRVSDADSAMETRSLVHVFAETSDMTVQVNMVWNCGWNRSAAGQLQLRSLRVTDFEEVQARPSQVAFPEVTTAAIGSTETYRTILAHGNDYWLERLEGRLGIFPTAWHGLAIGDVNNDGLEDIYICEPGGIANALFVRSADGTAENLATTAGVDIRDHTHSALFVDLDNDQDQDLVLGTIVGVLIFSNDGQGHFTQRTTKYTPDGMPFSLSAADFDADGDLDLYVCCYSKRHGTVASVFAGIEGRPIPYHDANNGARNLLLYNDGSWRFPDVTQRVGLGENNQRFSFAAAWEDYDNDGDLDLYVANDYGRNNLYRNQNGRFRDVARAAGVEDISAGMSVSWGDYDNDGWMDLYVANMFSSAGNRVTYQRRFMPSADGSTRADFQRHARGNSLFKNNGDGTFRDVSQSAEVTMGRWAWGSPLVDLNHDGRKDIICTNGFLTQELEDDL